MFFLCKKIYIAKSEEVKTGCNLTEFSKAMALKGLFF
jgi:hypothetical protein